MMKFQVESDMNAYYEISMVDDGFEVIWYDDPEGLEEIGTVPTYEDALDLIAHDVQATVSIDRWVKNVLAQVDSQRHAVMSQSLFSF